jgi:hypothetical protein
VSLLIGGSAPTAFEVDVKLHLAVAADSDFQLKYNLNDAVLVFALDRAASRPSRAASAAQFPAHRRRCRSHRAPSTNPFTPRSGYSILPSSAGRRRYILFVLDEGDRHESHTVQMVSKSWMEAGFAKRRS